MKKYIILLSFTAFSITSINTLGSSNSDFFSNNHNQVVKSSKISDELTSKDLQSLEDEEILYIARNLDGYIAIFVPHEILPCFLTDINVKSLPVSAQEMLSSGIIINESYGLANFIEDYSS